MVLERSWRARRRSSGGSPRIGVGAHAHDNLSQRDLDRCRLGASRAHRHHRCRRGPCSRGRIVLHDGWQKGRRYIGRWRRARHTVAQARTPTEQLLRTEAVPACHLRDDDAPCQALGDDLRLLPGRPLAPTLHTRDHLDPPQTRRRQHLLGVVITVNAMVKTVPAHGRHHAHGARHAERGDTPPLT